MRDSKIYLESLGELGNTGIQVRRTKALDRTVLEKLVAEGRNGHSQFQWMGENHWVGTEGWVLWDHRPVGFGTWNSRRERGQGEAREPGGLGRLFQKRGT